MIIKTIYDLDPEIKVDEELGLCLVELGYENKFFFGQANLSPLDEGFFSEKVGINIALSRARIQLLKYALDKAITIYNAKNQMYKEVVGKDLFRDPTGKFLANLTKAEKNVNRLRKALKKEKEGLKFYIKTQDAFIKRVKRLRQKDKNN